MSHSTKNRMKPNTANPCMARSSTAMALNGCRGQEGAQRVGVQRTGAGPPGQEQ